MSVQSETLGFSESCERSHEFSRRACSYTPKDVSWAGDMLVMQGSILKQSEVHDMRGGAADVAITHPAPSPACADKTVSMPSQYEVGTTNIRTGVASTFEFTIPKNQDPESETNWELAIYQSTGGDDDCGMFGFDGGDALQQQSDVGRVVSLCGTIDRPGVNPQAHYLDNRNSYSADPDNGLLVAIRTGLIPTWEVRYAPKERSLTSGLAMSDDVTASFMEQIAALGMGHADIFEFGMI